MKDKQREDSLDDKMIGMVERLLDEEEQDQPKNTPILMINSIPFANPLARIEPTRQISGKNLSRLGASLNSAQQIDNSPRGGLGIYTVNKKKYSDNNYMPMQNQVINKNGHFGSPNNSNSIEPISMNLNNLNMNFNKSNSLGGPNKQNFGIKVPQLNTINLNYPSAGQFQQNLSNNINLSSLRSCDNNLSTSSCTSNHSSEISIKTRSKRHVEESLMQEIDEQLENKVKLFEKIDEESLHHFKGNFLKIIKSQNGSRILQKALNRTPKEVFTLIFYEIKHALPDLLVDSYANYFCQRFYDHLEFKEKIEFLYNIKDSVVNISNSQIGTYPLQAIIDQMKTKDERKIIIEAVREHVLEMCQHAQGTHVIEKMILCFEEDSIKYIYDLILENFMFLACHCNGLCVTKKVIACSKDQVYISTIQKILLENASILVQNSHGNYSIQVALETWEYDYVYPLINLFHNQFFALSTQKFSSNVVEKCLERGGENILAKFLDEICHKSKILELMKNPFGNYVVQKALKLSTGFHRGKLTGIIKKHLEKLRDKKLINKWKDILNNISGNTLNLNHAKFNTLIKINNTQQNSHNTSMDSPNNSFLSSHSHHSHNFSHSPLSNNSPRSNRSTKSHNSFISNNSSNSFNQMGNMSPNLSPSQNFFMQNIMMNTNNINQTNLNNLYISGGQEARSGTTSPMLNHQINILPSSPRNPQKQYPWNQ